MKKKFISKEYQEHLQLRRDMKRAKWLARLHVLFYLLLVIAADYIKFINR